MKTLKENSISDSKLDYILMPHRQDMTDDYEDNSLVVIDRPFTFINRPKKILFLSPTIRNDRTHLDIDFVKFMVECFHQKYSIIDLDDSTVVNDLDRFLQSFINDTNKGIGNIGFYMYLTDEFQAT
jgi:hypothetical protein